MVAQALLDVRIFFRQEWCFFELVQYEEKEQGQESQHGPDLQQSRNREPGDKPNCMMGGIRSTVISTVTLSHQLMGSVVNSGFDHLEVVPPVSEKYQDRGEGKGTEFTLGVVAHQDQEREIRS